MQSITFSDLSNEQAMAMADGLLAAGQVAMATAIYEKVRPTTISMRNLLAAKMGLLRSPRPHTAQMLRVLGDLQGIGLNAFVGEGLATWHKTLPFYDDERFTELSDAHAALLPLPNWQWNLQTVLWAVQQVREVPGDFVELGVFKGHTTLFAAEYVDFGAWPKTWRLYDTFDGIPDDQVDDGWAARNKNLYKGSFSYEEVAARFAHIGNIKVTKGRVPEVLEGTAPETIAFMHVDMNNATAEIAALDKLFDRISPGGIVVFDDFCWTSARAQYDAETRWFGERGLHVLPLPTGQGVFVKR